MLSNGQKRAIHLAARQAGVDPKADEDSYRTVLLNVGGFRSAADRTARREGFIAVMAFFEARAGGRLRRSTAGYWACEDAKANRRDPLIWRIRQEAVALGMSDADAFLAGPHCSGGRYQSLAEAPTRWLAKCLEALKAMRRRRERAR